MEVVWSVVGDGKCDHIPSKGWDASTINVSAPPQARAIDSGRKVQRAGAELVYNHWGQVNPTEFSSSSLI
jgi:hypothetical protein